MVVVSLKKEDLSCLGNYFDVEGKASSISFFGETGTSELSLGINVGNQTEKLNSDGSCISEAFFVLQLESPITEKISSSIDSEADSVLKFLIESSNSEDIVKAKFASSTSKIQFTCGDIVFSVKANYSILQKEQEAETNEILSFTKEEFNEQFYLRASKLSQSMEWFNKKISGLNVVVSDSSAYVYVGTKAFYFKNEITKGTFHKESSGLFVHDKGIIIIKDEAIAMILSIAKDEDIIKITVKSSCSRDEQTSFFSIKIGTKCNLSFSCFSRKKTDIIVSTIVNPFLSEEATKTAVVNLISLKKFFSVFKENPIFLNEVISLKFNSSKGTINISPIDSASELFSFSLTKCKVSQDFTFNINFFVLSSILNTIQGETISFKEKASNEKRINISDGTSEFILEKVILRQN